MFSPLSQQELQQIEAFIRREYGKGSGRFGLTPDWKLRYQLADSGGDTLTFAVVEIDTGKNIVIEMQPFHFPSRSPEDLEAPMSQRVIDMTLAIERFLHITDFESVVPGQIIKIEN